MPELPDLQVFSDNLQRKIAGKKLDILNSPIAKKLNMPLADVKKAVEGQVLSTVKREGKTLQFLFANDHVLGLHLMLNGELFFYEGANPHKNVIAEFLFDDGSALTLTDYQQLAAVTLDPEQVPAPDALSDKITIKFLAELLASRKAAVKNILLDQKLIRGIGNAYADEILWEARISPFAIANKIPETQVEALHRAIHRILVDAEKQIKKANPDIITGEIRDFLKVHGPKISESPTGAEVKVKRIGGRKTYYTDEQVMFD